MRVLAIVVIMAALAVVLLAIFGSTAPRPKQDLSAPTKRIDTRVDAGSTRHLEANAVATTLRAVPGAVVCDDLPTVRLIEQQYIDYWGDTMALKMTNGASRVVNGPLASEPNPSQYGCALLSPGTPVEVQPLLPGILRVTAITSVGHLVSGITQENMVRKIDLLPTETRVQPMLPDAPETSGPRIPDDQHRGRTE